MKILECLLILVHYCRFVGRQITDVNCSTQRNLYKRLTSVLDLSINFFELLA